MGCSSSIAPIAPIQRQLSFSTHEENLAYNLESCDIQRVEVRGDGNCLFYALGYGLIYEIQKDPYFFGLRVQRRFQLPTEIPLEDFARRLRQICVDYWRMYKQFYSQFVNTQKLSFDEEIFQFSRDGVCDSALGDIVPLTISNAFNVKIFIITSISHLSRIEVKPVVGFNSAEIPPRTIFLAYNQYDVGHYDAAYPRSS